jgi:hypothetical protein
VNVRFVILLIAAAPLWAQTARLRIRVVDLRDAAITTAKASLIGADGQPIRAAMANASGEIVWTGLPLGESTV